MIRPSGRSGWLPIFLILRFTHWSTRPRHPTGSENPCSCLTVRLMCLPSWHPRTRPASPRVRVPQSGSARRQTGAENRVRSACHCWDQHFRHDARRRVSRYAEHGGPSVELGGCFCDRVRSSGCSSGSHAATLATCGAPSSGAGLTVRFAATPFPPRSGNCRVGHHTEGGARACWPREHFNRRVGESVDHRRLSPIPTTRLTRSRLPSALRIFVNMMRLTIEQGTNSHKILQQKSREQSRSIG
jgi:hypothetical protein